MRCLCASGRSGNEAQGRRSRSTPGGGFETASRLTKDEALVEAVSRDHRQAGLDPGVVAMLDFVEGIAATPPRARESDVALLRGQGWSDAAILDMVQVAAYYAFVNRLADGLGVELEDHWPPEVRRRR